jgi:glycosyltransferase involved in cell wall biosynthesis/exopolysaccharide biosynthesis predicted pyruvyltransferase EpsI
MHPPPSPLDSSRSPTEPVGNTPPPPDVANDSHGYAPTIPLPHPELAQQLVAELLAWRGKRIAVLFNQGNRGDGVIHLGGRRLLKTLGLEGQEFHQSTAPATITADVLLVFGGGAFCREVHTVVSLVEHYATQVPRVIILPASFDLRSERVRRFVQSWSDNYTVFTREQRSFAALRSARPDLAKIFLCYDLAFWADLHSWAERPHSGTAGIFRRDAEAVFDRRPLHLEGRDISRGPDSEPEGLLNYVSRFSTIYTDRAHAAITAAMMGREVHLYRNGYFKNEALYEHSLSHLPHVSFVGKQPFSYRQCAEVLFTYHVRRNAYRARRRWRQTMGRASAHHAGTAVQRRAASEQWSSEARPALSVIMPAYNAGRFLAPAIESVLNQSFRDFEFIIIDDASTDGTRATIEAYAVKDPRIRSCPNPENKGITYTLNRGLSLARADWIARMDADDLSLPGRFEKQMSVARQDPAIGLVTCPFDVIDAQERIVPGWRGICFQRELLPFFLLFYNRLNAHGQVLYSTKVVRELGGYREGYHLSEATELWIRLVRHTKWAVVPEPLYAWRAANPNSVTKQNTFRYADASLRACQEEVARACGLNLTREQMIALRDFWLRFEEKGRDWREVETLLGSIARAYHPPHPTPGWSRKVSVAIACAWLAHAALQLKHRRMRRAAEHVGRAARISKVYLPLAIARFTVELAAVRGRVCRRS